VETTRNLIAFLFAVALPMAAQAPAAPESPVAPDAEIRKILAERIDTAHQSVGIVVGIIEPRGRRIVTYGSRAKDDKRPLDGDTVFEIGSVTKVFTSLLLADMVERKEVALDDPVAKYLPPDVKVPEFDGHKITLQSLSMQTSGLPRLPTNLAPKDPANPYADYSVAQLYQFLSSFGLTRDVGSQYEYSNLGVGLLGHALARRAGMDYEALVRSRIAEPLGMANTRITLSPEMKDRLAVGYSAAMSPTFLAANLGATKTPLAPAMAAMLKIRRMTGAGGLETALGWLVSESGGRTFVWHNGGTGGYRSFIGFDRARGAGVVVLSNAGTVAGVDDIGRHLLDPQAPLLNIQPHTEIAIDPKLLDLYVGRYALATGAILTVTREGNRLFAQLTGQGKYQIHPESERGFFYRVVDAQITFEATGQQPATALILRQNGRDHRAVRTEREPTPPKQHKEISVDPKLFDRYVGKYAITTEFQLTVTQEGGHLFAQATGQRRFELFPESERDYFVKDFDAQVTFEVQGQDRATGLVLHQNGKDQHAHRVEGPAGT